jgi:YbbR domain-containing protein
MSDEPRTMSRRLRPALVSIRRFMDTGNFLRFLVAVVLAFGLWAWVTYESDPETTRTLGGMTVTLENLANNLEVVGDPPVVDITVQGPQSIVGPLERETVVARVDMEDIEETGEYELDVNVDVPSGIRVRDVLPETVVIEVDRISSRTDVPVVIVEPDDVPPNYQVREISTEVETVTISGPELSIDRVTGVEIQVQIDGRTASFNDSWAPRAVDDNGQEVAGVQIDPNEIMVSVTLDIRGQIRKIIPVIVGDDALAPGFELVRTTVLPADEVVVDGPEEDLAGIFFVTTVPIDISGWDDSEIVRDVEIDRARMPESVTLDIETVHVSIEIRRQIHQREITGIPINVMNPASGTIVTLNPESATVVLEGSRTAIDAIDPNDITVFVNVANAEPGEYEFELRVIVPAQVQYREVDPPFVDVVVRAEPTDNEDNDVEDL